MSAAAQAAVWVQERDGRWPAACEWEESMKPGMPYPCCEIATAVVYLQMPWETSKAAHPFCAYHACVLSDLIAAGVNGAC